MAKLGFFSAVTYGNQPTTCTQKILEKVDGYLHLGSTKYQVIDPKKGKVTLSLADPGSYWKAALKVASYALLIPVLVALIAKIILRCVYSFTIVKQREASKPVIAPVSERGVSSIEDCAKRVIRECVSEEGIDDAIQEFFDKGEIPSEIQEEKQRRLKEIQKESKLNAWYRQRRILVDPRRPIVVDNFAAIIPDPLIHWGLKEEQKYAYFKKALKAMNQKIQEAMADPLLSKMRTLTISPYEFLSPSELHFRPTLLEAFLDYLVEAGLIYEYQKRKDGQYKIQA